MNKALLIVAISLTLLIAPAKVQATVTPQQNKCIADSLFISGMGIATYVNRSGLTADSGTQVGKMIGNMTLDVEKCLP